MTFRGIMYYIDRHQKNLPAFIMIRACRIFMRRLETCIDTNTFITRAPCSPSQKLSFQRMSLNMFGGKANNDESERNNLQKRIISEVA